MTKVHIARVMKVCFFFSYSDCGAGSGAFSSSVAQSRVAFVSDRPISGRSGFVGAPFRVGLLAPLCRDELRSSVGESFPLLIRRSRCWNLTSFFGLVMAAWVAAVRFDHNVEQRLSRCSQVRKSCPQGLFVCLQLDEQDVWSLRDRGVAKARREIGVGCCPVSERTSVATARVSSSAMSRVNYRAVNAGILQSNNGEMQVQRCLSSSAL